MFIISIYAFGWVRARNFEVNTKQQRELINTSKQLTSQFHNEIFYK